MAELKRPTPSKAIEILEKLRADRGDFPQAMLLLGDAYLATSNSEKAREVWESTAAIRSGIALHERLGKLYDGANERQKSLQQKTLRLQAVGIANLRNSHMPDAAKAFQQALAADDSLSMKPGSTLLNVIALAECHRLSGRLEAALEAYRRCLENKTATRARNVPTGSIEPNLTSFLSRMGPFLAASRISLWKVDFLL